MNHILDNKIQLEDAQGDVFGLRTSGGVLIFDPCGMASTWLTRENCTQLWPIIKHYAETGELVEAPNVIDNSIPARDDASWSDMVVERLAAIEERLGIAQEAGPVSRCEVVISFAEGDPYTYACDSKKEALEKTDKLIRNFTGWGYVITTIAYMESHSP